MTEKPLLSGLLFVLTLVLLLTVGTAVPVGAEESSAAVIEVMNETVYRGQTFEVTVNLKENSGLISMLLQLEYDRDVFTLTGAVRGDALKTLAYSTTNENTEQGYSAMPFRFLWDGREQDNSDGTLLILTFESNIEAETGDYPITFTYDKNNTKSEYGVPADVEIVQNKITLLKGEYSVIYKNFDNTILFEKDYNENEIPSYLGNTPVRAEDEKYSYVFNKFVGAVSDNEKEIIYIADYIRNAKTYQVFLYSDGEYYDAFECKYGEAVLPGQPPARKNYTFDGWYTDEECTVRYTALFMGPSDLRLYGKYEYNVRTEPIPEISLTVVSVENNIATVDVSVINNPGFSGLVLTLDYDRSSLEFSDFDESPLFGDLQFDHTKDLTADNYKFYWESVKNNYITGKLLTLKFKVSPEAMDAVYNITFTYNEKSDATFLTENGELWYTKVKINGCGIPVGKRFTWHEQIENKGLDIKVESDIGMPIDTILEIDLITADIVLPEEKVFEIAGDNMYLTDAYKVTLKRNGNEVQPSGKLIIRIKLTEQQKLCSVLKLYYVNDSEEMIPHESHIEGDELVFVTDHLSSWVIIGDKLTTSAVGTVFYIIITLLILLVIAMSSYILILISQNRRRYKSVPESDNCGDKEE